MPDLPPPGVFLSYRREDAAPYARLLQYELRERLSGAQVFMDLDSIEPGLDFAEVIQEALASCAVLVALIGRQWLTLVDEAGGRRLDNPDDYVRFEVQTALERGVRVIPVLVDGARVPQRSQLPGELQKLARLNALELSYGRYQFDADRLIGVIQRILGAPPPPDENAPAPVDPERVSRILQDALHSADSITSERWKAVTLAEVAKAMAATDPELADRLIAAAERLTELIDGETDRAEALGDIAGALASVRPGEAELIAQSITGESPQAKSAKAWALANVAKAVAATDQRRADGLIREAERIALAITGEIYRPSALAAVAKALAAVDRFRAEEVIDRIDDNSWATLARADLAVEATLARADLAVEVAATDPDWAAHLIAEAKGTARRITDKSPQGQRSKVTAVISLAKAVAVTDPAAAVRLIDEAERIAQSITDTAYRTPALHNVAGTLAAFDPERAELLAQSITDDFYGPLALAEVAGAMAATDPARGEHIAQSISYGTARDRALANVAAALAATDPGRAERVAQSITDDLWKARALLGLVGA